MSAFDRFVVMVLSVMASIIGAVILLGDHVGVPMSDLSPTNGSQPPMTTDVRLTFGVSMDQASVQAHFTVDPPIKGTFHWENNTMIFTPTGAFVDGTRYIVHLTAGAASSSARQTIQDISTSFTPRSLRALYL